MPNDNAGRDLRLIEDYLPIEAISKEASREKSVRKGHISTLHLWWARRPLVACRAAVYGALVTADRWVKDVKVKNSDGKDVKAFKNGTKRGLNRKHAKEFVTKLCRYPKSDPTQSDDTRLKRETEAAIIEAQKHILEAHAERLTHELDETKKTGKSPAWMDEYKFTADTVTSDDIIAGRAPRPRVLDMFAGGGAIPLEALRLGCDAYALDLNPVAHIIQLCTLVYPQKYGKPNPSARGMTGAKNARGEATWGGLAAEVHYWGNWVLDRVRKEISDLYPLIPDPAYKPHDAASADKGKKMAKGASGVQNRMFSPGPATGGQNPMFDDDADDEGDAGSATTTVPPGFLMPVAYLWTRTVRCKNPACDGTVPLVKQTWLCRRKNRSIALRLTAPEGERQPQFELVSASSEAGIGFDPGAFSQSGNATCPFCGTVADADYVQQQGLQGRVRELLMAGACVRATKPGKVYVAGPAITKQLCLDPDVVQARLKSLCSESGIGIPDEIISSLRPSPNARGLSAVTRHGITSYARLFTDRQLIFLLSVARAISDLPQILRDANQNPEQVAAVVTPLSLLQSTIANANSSFCRWIPQNQQMGSTFSKNSLAMTWDFAEINPLGGASGDTTEYLRRVVEGIEAACVAERPAHVSRGTATALPWPDCSLDAVVTDPPYYDNIPYADLSDFFYVWLKRTAAPSCREHVSLLLTPKKHEATALSSRHDGNMESAREKYEALMATAFREAHRVLVSSGTIVVVYAHKTTLGWSTLVDALRTSGFVVTEAWPLDTEKPGRLMAYESAALASSIFLVARKRVIAAGVGNYEDDVQPDLQQIVRERVETLWDMGITGADLVIACVGAGLRAFTKYENVEYANGEEVPAEKFLAEVEGVVLDTMMGKLFGQAGATVSAIDPASRFYILWRYVYKAAEIDAGEAIVFTYAQHVELDGAQGLSGGKDALVEKKKAKYRVRDFTERGHGQKLGLPDDTGRPTSLIDALHRVLWLMENSPKKLADFLEDARPDRERLRVLAQALAGAALSGKSEEDSDKLVTTTPMEQAALGKLLANWRTLIEFGTVVASVGKVAAKDKDQMNIDFKKQP